MTEKAYEMTEELKQAIKDINTYAGAAGDPDTQPLGTCAVPVRFLQALRRAMTA